MAMAAKIPKIIHYCRYGDRPWGTREKNCLKSWTRLCPDYEIILWDETNSPLEDNRYAKEALSAKKWAFVSDYARLKVLALYGGIYLDTDVELLKPLDQFLNQSAFLGFESATFVATCVIGCVPNHPFIGELVELYDQRKFLIAPNAYDLTTNTAYITELLQKRGLKRNGEEQTVADMRVYTPDVFCPLDLKTGKLALTDNSAAIHHFAGSWMTTSQKINTRLAQFLGERNTILLKNLLRRNNF